MPDARAVIEQALQYDYPQKMPDVHALHGIIVLRQQDLDTAKQVFTNAIAKADALLSNTPKNYSALDAKGLALYGLALCEKDQNPAGLVQEAKRAFQAARKITGAKGIVNRVKRLLDELKRAK